MAEVVLPTEVVISLISTFLIAALGLIAWICKMLLSLSREVKANTVTLEDHERRLQGRETQFTIPVSRGP